MHQALWLLTKLGIHASWRRLIRSAKTLRGALLLLFTIGFLGMMILPALVTSFGKPQPMGDFLEVYGPFAMLLYALALLLFSLGDQAIRFSASEIDFLFPAPFSRKELLAYKIANNVSSTIFLSVILAVTLRVQYSSWIAGFCGLFLTLSFLQLLSILTSLIGQTISGQAYTRGRRVVAISIIAALAFSASQALTQWQGTEISEIPRLVESSTIGKVLLAPFRIFCDMITAERLLPDFLTSASIAGVMLAGLVICIFRLDADYSETAIRVSQRRYERQRKMQRGEGIVNSKKARATPIPMLPFFFGSGPLIWRNLVETTRTFGGMLRVAMIVGVAMGIPAYIQLSKQPLTSPFIPYTACGVMAYVSMLISSSMPVGFRADVERIEFFKNLPISSWSVVLGQLIGPTLLMSMTHWLLFALLFVLLPHFTIQWTLGACLMPLFNSVLFSVSNAVFLFFPVKIAAGANADFQTGMKNMVMILLQYLVLVLAIGAAGGVATSIYFVSKSVILTGFVAGTLLGGECVLGVVLVWVAYVRFDVAKHVS